MERYICIHGHFYQPPRENPWLEMIELQDSAAPYHDWNERITAECYAPNAAARLLDEQGRIRRIINNYARISFNVGPTLLAWMRVQAPQVYAAILEADRESIQRFYGHGSAIAQVYNHLIMPLANRRDRLTQIRWGIRDFTFHFGRRPAGMWLAETAVDLETLELLVAEGIRYTILSPLQARRMRAPNARDWVDVSNGRIDPTRAYRLRLPSGRTIALFFYDGPISRAVAFERLLNNGESFARRLMGGFNDIRRHAQLVHIATDGETYGHHHRRGEMALAYALQSIEAHGVRLTNYGAYLERYPPEYEVEIFERSSWSCIHGIGRWMLDCGCNSGGYPHWRQHWRAPLRAALDWLRDDVNPRYERLAGELLRDPWAARDDYIELILDRGVAQRVAFLERHARRPLSAAEQVLALELLELQRYLQLMYTSCGWFFDELSGIETVQVIMYAGRAVQLAERSFGPGIEAPFLERLAHAHSNLPEYKDGRWIYEHWVRPAMVDLPRVAAFYAVSSLFESYADDDLIFSYRVRRLETQNLTLGRTRLLIGQAEFESQLTGEQSLLAYAVLHFGDHTVNCGVGAGLEAPQFAALANELAAAFARSDFPEVIRSLDRAFNGATHSLRTLFRDEQRRGLQAILDATLREYEAIYRQLYERDAPLMRFLASIGAPIPPAFLAAARFILDLDLQRTLGSEVPDERLVQQRVEESKAWHITLDTPRLSFVLRGTLARLAQKLLANPEPLETMNAAHALAGLCRELPFAVELDDLQRSYHLVLHQYAPAQLNAAIRGDAAARAWVQQFAALGERLNFSFRETPLENLALLNNLDQLLQSALARRRTPRATYRLQFNNQFTLRDAQNLVEYLDQLGVSDIYASPILRARPGSAHGYDICDHSQINPELGGQPALDALVAALAPYGMGLLLDTVPNHMGIGGDTNTWWIDVLENGPGSIYADYFDIDWRPLNPDLAGKVLLPILEDQYGSVLEAGKLKLLADLDQGTFAIHYYEHRLPVAPRSYRRILEPALESASALPGPNDLHVLELQSIITAIGYLPRRENLSEEKLIERNREKEVIKRRIATLCQQSPELRLAIANAVETFAGNPADPQSFDALDRLIDEQSYRLSFWRVATEEINYRRFFDINDLAAIRVELPEVFKATHELFLDLLSEGKAVGLRIDHIDGLYDPAAYLRQLQIQFVRRNLERQALLADSSSIDDALIEAQLNDWMAAQAERQEHTWPLYVVVEKILAEGERLPTNWAADGTSGYDFLNLVNGLCIDQQSRSRFDTIYRQFTGVTLDFHNLVNSSKKMIMLVALASELNELSYQIERMAERTRRYRDFTLNSLTFALREVLACLPVYRTYITGPQHVQEHDQHFLEAAVAEARRRNPRTARAIFDFLADTLLLRNLESFRPEDRSNLVELVMTFQQLSGPVMAKGVEDTAFYVYNRLIALNEVGGHPQHFGNSLAEFHQQNQYRSTHWPQAMLTTSTHDTKRSEDVRARIAVLSEMPDDWEACVQRWSALNAQHKTRIDNLLAPDANDEYLLYQTLIGVWPIETPPLSAGAAAAADLGLLEVADANPAGNAADSGPLISGSATDGAASLAWPLPAELRERVTGYMVKATSEAKVHTSWINPNQAYNEAVRTFIAALLPDDGAGNFVAELRAFQQRTAFFGRFNSLSQTLIKLSAPGVPDFYQGNELWDLSLVDPDNRRPVDFALRKQLLSDLRRQVAAAGPDLRGLARELLAHAEDGRIKLYLIQRLLELRRNQPQLFDGDYQPLAVDGAQALHAVAYARNAGELLIVAPRLSLQLARGELLAPLGGLWGVSRLLLPAELNGQRYRDLFTGTVHEVEPAADQPGLPLAGILADFPLAALIREPVA